MFYELRNGEPTIKDYFAVPQAVVPKPKDCKVLRRPINTAEHSLLCITIKAGGTEPHRTMKRTTKQAGSDKLDFSETPKQ